MPPTPPTPGRPDRADPALFRRPPLPRLARETLFAALLRNAEAHDNLAAAVAPDHWVSLGLAAVAVWKGARAYREANGALPNGPNLAAAGAEALAEYGVADPDTEAAVRALADRVFEPRYDALAVDPTVPANAARVVSKLLEEEAAAAFSRTVFDGLSMPADVTAAAERFADQVRQAQAVVRPALPRAFEDGWDDETAEAVPTPLGVDLLDNYFGGGMLGGEVALFMAPYGVCKTVLAVQATYAAALRCQLAHAAGGPKKLAVFVSTEMALPEFRRRTITHGGQIPFARMKQAGRPARLTDDPRPGMRPETAYELGLFPPAPGVPFRSEKRRVQDVVDLINEYCLFVELTDSNELLRGNPGSVEDAAGIVAENVRRLGADGVELVVLDHASAMAARVVERSGAADPDRATRRLLKVIPLRVRDLLARKYGCPALVMHQLSGEANSKSPFAALHHSHGAECKAVAEYCDFAMVVGQTSNDGDTRLAVVRVTKPRREAPKPPGVVRIDGELAAVRDASREYTADFDAQEFVPAVGRAGRGGRPGAAYAYPAPAAAGAAAAHTVFPPGLDVS